jgi:phosphoribosylanthranilate isomerase
MNTRTRIKICGLTREADVDAAVQAGADAIGFVFYVPSVRALTFEQAARLAKCLPPFVTPVGLFVNASDDVVRQGLQALPHMLLQFHGDETPQQCRAFGRPYMRAVRMRVEGDLLKSAAMYSDAQALLLDAHVDGYGGGGKVFDWSLISQANAGSPPGVLHPVVLSGGLNAANVAAGINTVQPWAVDVSSGVESSKGVKDAGLIRQFCDLVREADARIAASCET